MRAHFSLIALLVLLAWARLACAIEFALVSPDGMTEAQQKSVDDLAAAIQRKQGGRSVQRLTPGIAAGLKGDELILIAIGRDAFADILRGSGQLPVLAVYISPSSYSDVLVQFPKATARSVGAIYSGPDPHRQLALARIFFGEKKLCYAVMSPHSAETTLTDLTNFSRRIGLQLQYIPARSNTTERDILREVNGTGVILIDKDTIRESKIDIGRLLLGSYVQYETGVIGFGQDFAAAGGLASTYSSTDQLVDDLLNTVDMYGTTKSLARPHFVRDFSVAINMQLLNVLRLEAHTESSVQSEIKRMLSEPGAVRKVQP